MNGADVLRNCLKSIREVDYEDLEVVVVDNGSTDGSQRIVPDEFPLFHVIENGRNLGVPEAQNIGIRHCLNVGSDYVFVLNNDLILDREVIRELLKYSAGSDIGISGPIMYWPQKPTVVQSAGGIIRWDKGDTRLMFSGEIRDQMQETYDIDYMGLPFVKAEVFGRVGFYDPAYFAYWEDTDFCARVKRAGYRVISVSSAKIWHEGSHTTKMTSGFVTYHSARNRFRFMKRNATKAQYRAFLLRFALLQFWFEAMVHLALPQKAGGFAPFLRGTFAGLTSRPR
jgi:GT2 family glycosyltransferase